MGGDLGWGSTSCFAAARDDEVKLLANYDAADRGPG
jgi:hypothetical protein